MGDIMEVFTEGKFLATKHRVVVPQEELLRQQPRQSIAFFIHPNHDILVKPLIQTENKKQTDEDVITAFEHTMLRFKATYV